MYRIIIIVLVCLNAYVVQAQNFSGEYTTEWQWNMNNKTNWLNLLRLNLSIPVGKGNDSFEAVTLHVAKTNETIIDDWQGFSNIEADDMFAAIAVLGYMHEWKSGHLFVGVRNVNEDFFTSDVTSLFANGSGGIFPTISASYPIANYPLSGLTIYFDVTKGGWTFRNSIYNGVGYNGWKRNNNPFIVKPKRDGIFNMSQLEYQYPDTTLPVLPFTHATLKLMTKAKWQHLTMPQTTPLAHGGYMANKRYGRLTIKTYRLCCNIRRIQTTATAATGLPKLDALIKTVKTSVAYRLNMPASIKAPNAL